MNISFWTCPPDIRLQDKCSQIERALKQFTLNFLEAGQAVQTGPGFH